MKKWHKGVDARANVRLYLRGQKQTTNRELHMSYRELQATLKQLRTQGATLQVKLNATKVKLQAEYERLTGNKIESQVDELAAAKARIAELEAIVETQKQTMLKMAELMQTKQEPTPEHVADAPAPTTSDEQAQAVIESFGNYASFPQLGAALNMQPEQVKALVLDLDKRGLVELSTVAEPKEHNTDEIDNWGIEMYAGGSLFFAAWVETEDKANATAARRGI